MRTCALFTLIFLSASLLLVAARGRTSDDPAFAQIDSIVKSLSEITGLKEKNPVPYGRISKRQLRHFLTKRMRKTLRPEELYADELTLKMFGLVPPEFDLRRSTIDLLTEQAAAFYDYDEKKLFLLDDPAVPAETTTLAHELAHALADQYFDLQKFMEDTPENDDENLAHSAVVEGQASWLMLAYELKKAGQPIAPSPEMLKSVVESGDASMGDFPVLKAAPLYIQQSLLFPYAQGTAFFDAVYKKMGQRAFSAVFTESPADTTQILHPDRYFIKVKPTEPSIPRLTSESNAEEVAEGSVGEFDHRILLKQYAGGASADQLSPHLRGGQFRIITIGKQQKPVLEYASQWDSESSAANFFTSYERVLKSKWKRCDIAIENRATFAGIGDNGYFVTRLLGEIVSSVEGLTDVREWQRLSYPPELPASARVH